MSIQTQISVQCPWCWEIVDFYLSPDTSGEFVEDCEVCCRPWAIRVQLNEQAEQTIQIERSN